MPGRERGRCHRADLAARIPSGVRQCRAVCRVPAPVPGADEPPGVSGRQDAGDAPAPHQVREHALFAGAQLQGVARRSARPADDPVGVPGGRSGQHLEGAGRQRHGHGLRGAPDRAQRSAALPDSRAPACSGRAARRPAGVRPADRRGRVFWLPFAGTRWIAPAHAGQRKPDAPLLLGSQGGVATQSDPAAQHRRAPEPIDPRAAPDQRALLREGGPHRSGE